jgi:hypothetical protein
VAVLTGLGHFLFAPFALLLSEAPHFSASTGNCQQEFVPIPEIRVSSLSLRVQPFSSHFPQSFRDFPRAGKNLSRSFAISLGTNTQSRARQGSLFPKLTA